MDEIVKLLEQATTPLERSILLHIMQQRSADEEHTRLQRELTACVQKLTDTFGQHRGEFIEHRVEFNKHVIEEGQLLTWGTRIFAITASLLVFIVSLFGWYTVHHILDVNAMQQTMIDLNGNRLTAIESILRTHLEDRK